MQILLKVPRTHAHLLCSLQVWLELSPVYESALSPRLIFLGHKFHLFWIEELHIWPLQLFTDKISEKKRTTIKISRNVTLNISDLRKWDFNPTTDGTKTSALPEVMSVAFTLARKLCLPWAQIGNSLGYYYYACFSFVWAARFENNYSKMDSE